MARPRRSLRKRCARSLRRGARSVKRRVDRAAFEQTTQVLAARRRRWHRPRGRRTTALAERIAYPRDCLGQPLPDSARARSGRLQVAPRRGVGGGADHLPGWRTMLHAVLNSVIDDFIPASCSSTRRGHGPFHRRQAHIGWSTVVLPRRAVLGSLQSTSRGMWTLRMDLWYSKGSGLSSRAAWRTGCRFTNSSSAACMRGVQAAQVGRQRRKGRDLVAV